MNQPRSLIRSPFVIGILHFFETGPIERVELLFMIVAEKVRERLGARDSATGTALHTGSVRRRRIKAGAEGASEPSPPEP